MQRSILFFSILLIILGGCKNKSDIEKYYSKNQQQLEILKDFVLSLDSVQNIDCDYAEKYSLGFMGDTSVREEIYIDGHPVDSTVFYHDTILYRQGLSIDELNEILQKKENSKFPDLTIPFEAFFWYDKTKNLLNLRFTDMPDVDFVYSKEVVDKSEYAPDDKTQTYLTEHWYAWHPWRAVKIN